MRVVMDIALAVAVIGALALAAARIPESPAQVLSGAARVSDGDSLRLSGERIRLKGIDAPELGQSCARGGADYPCGREARDVLVGLIGGEAVSCESRRRDRYGRLLARCFARGADLNRAMVEQGWAVAYGDHRDAERTARQAGRGLWEGEFQRPQDWRRAHGGRTEAEHGGLSGIIDRLRELFLGTGPDQDETEGETG